MNTEALSPRKVLSAYQLEVTDIRLVSSGNINLTYTVTDPASRQYILQRVNRIFAPDIHEDIEAVTSHLEQKGLLTPRLVRNRQGALFTGHDGEIWRLMTRISGITVDTVADRETAAAAGKLLARFHRALTDLDHDFVNRRTGIHDTDGHLQNLQSTLDRCRAHPRYEAIAPLAGEILEQAAGLPAPPAGDPRKVHGDPKINNILFEPATGVAKCLIDLDTLGNMHLSLELGDALRSWCNPRGEDTAGTEFSLAHFEAAMEAYAGEARGFILEQEWHSILPATLRICIELAARFCADALNESYFNWDPQRFGSCSEHNEVRARGQLQSARSLKSQYKKAEKIIERVFG